MEFIDFGWNRQMGEVPLGFVPSNLPNLQLWTRYNQGITVTGAGVSQWDDQSGNDNHLLQAVDANRPSKEADGSVLFDGIAHFLKAAAFTFAQPATVYLLIKQVTWTLNDVIMCGDGLFPFLQQTATTPDLKVNPGTTAGPANSDLIVDTYSVVSLVFDGANSLIQIDNNTPITGGAGTAALAGFTLGARGNSSLFSNIQSKENAAYSGAHDAATRAKVIAYLSSL